MSRLIIRDLFIYQRRNFLVFLGFAIYFNILRADKGSGAEFALSLLSAALLAFYATAQTAFAYDEMCNTNKLLRAMPIRPSTIVNSRYASCFLSAAMSMAVMSIVTLLFNLHPTFHKEISVSLEMAVICLTVFLVFSAIMPPLIFKMGYMKAKYPLMAIYIALFTAAPTLLSSSAWSESLSDFIASIPSAALYTLLPVIALIFMVGSILLSSSIFSKKEF